MAHRLAYRSQQITIDLPREGQTPWAEIKVQGVELDDDGKPVAEHNDVYRIRPRRADLIAGETETITDPITGQTFTASGLGLQLLIRAFALRWIAEDTGATYDAKLDRMIAP